MSDHYHYDRYNGMDKLLSTDCISRKAAIDAACKGFCHPGARCPDVQCWEKTKYLREIPTAQPEIIRCKDCRYYKAITSIYGECESADMWQSLFGEITEVEAIEVHKDHYCGYAERREVNYESN